LLSNCADTAVSPPKLLTSFDSGSPIGLTKDF
jgi:hypothetical protein